MNISLGFPDEDLVYIRLTWVCMGCGFLPNPPIDHVRGFDADTAFFNIPCMKCDKVEWSLRGILIREVKKA
jgi:hypothetical protein